MNTYYIAHPAPVTSLIEDFRQKTGLDFILSNKHNQVMILHSELTIEELKHIIDDYMLIIINDELEDWGIYE